MEVERLQRTICNWHLDRYSGFPARRRARAGTCDWVESRRFRACDHGNRSSYGNTITAPQPDDIAGVNALYSSVPPVDSTGPAVVITSHSNGQTVTTTSITLSGAATD